MLIISHKSNLKVETLNTGRTRQWLAHKELGAECTALLENYLNPGGFVPLHYHNTEEVLVCLEGVGKIIVSSELYDFSCSCTVVVPAGLVHEIRNTGKERLRLLGFFPVAEPQTTWL